MIARLPDSHDLDVDMAFPEVEPDARPRPPAGGGFGRLMAAYALACLAAVIVLPILLFLRDLVAIGPSAAADHVDSAALAAIVVVGFPVIFVFAAPFATALIVATQALRMTSLSVYAVGGAVIGPLVGLVAHLMPTITPEPGATPWGSFVLYAVVGLASGVVFWYSAVRPSRPRR
jgi:hypothetical protein